MSYLSARSQLESQAIDSYIESKPVSSERPTDSIFTVDDVAIFLKIPKATIYKLVRQKTIPAHKVGKHWRFLRDEVETWLRGR